jgi:hypothetical protein
MTLELAQLAVQLTARHVQLSNLQNKQEQAEHTIASKRWRSGQHASRWHTWALELVQLAVQLTARHVQVRNLQSKQGQAGGGNHVNTLLPSLSAATITIRAPFPS